MNRDNAFDRLHKETSAKWEAYCNRRGKKKRRKKWKGKRRKPLTSTNRSIRYNNTDPVKATVRYVPVGMADVPPWPGFDPDAD